jgi:hypothetical protein
LLFVELKEIQKCISQSFPSRTLQRKSQINCQLVIREVVEVPDNIWTKYFNVCVNYTFKLK